VKSVLEWDGFESKLDRLFRNWCSLNCKEELRFWACGGTFSADLKVLDQFFSSASKSFKRSKVQRFLGRVKLEKVGLRDDKSLKKV
jgi:hypothetical protein